MNVKNIYGLWNNWFLFYLKNDILINVYIYVKCIYIVKVNFKVFLC